VTATSLLHRLPALALGAVGVGIIPIGTRFLVRPEAAAAGFGLRTAPRDPYLAVKGIRDIASGLVLLLALAHDRRIAGRTALAAATIPLGDMILVLTRGGSRRVAFGVHGATGLVMIAAAVTLRGVPGIRRGR
jgi:Domain of unknown function (DUF4267)